MPEIAVVIPAYNEEDIIKETVVSAKNIQNVSEVIVVDDGSNDETPFIAYDAGARVIQSDNNTGKGGAMNKALAECDADIMLMIDADLGASAVETGRLLDPILAGQADMAIAIIKPPPGHKGGFGIVVTVAKWAIRKYGGSDVTAPISGQRAIKKEVLKDIGRFEEGFGLEVALTIDALRKGHRIVEVPLPLTHRFTGRNLKGFLHRGKQLKDILNAVWKRRK